MLNVKSVCACIAHSLRARKSCFRETQSNSQLKLFISAKAERNLEHYISNELLDTAAYFTDLETSERMEA